jgi:ribosomal protein S18 acetylase RimI-like enzyme
MEHEDIGAVLAVDRSITGVKRAVTYTDLITGDLGKVLDLSVVAEVRGEVVGFIVARHAVLGEPVGEAGLIQIFGVDPDYWGNGIGRKMMNFLMERCQSKGLKTVRLLVNESDSQLQDFMKHLGFKRSQLMDFAKEL